MSLQEQQQLELISSEILEFELSQNPDKLRRTYVAEVLSSATITIRVNDRIQTRARELEARGIRGMDALHLACAEAARVDTFCSCDDRLLRKARTIVGLHVRVVSLLELVEELVK